MYGKHAKDILSAYSLLPSPTLANRDAHPRRLLLYAHWRKTELDTHAPMQSSEACLLHARWCTVVKPISQFAIQILGQYLRGILQ